MLGLVTGVPSMVPVEIARKDGLVYHWYPQSPDVVDSGPLEKAYVTSLVTVSTEAGDRVAYLRVSYMTRELCDVVFYRPLAYASSHRGWCLPLDGDETELWCRVHQYARRTPASLVGSNVRTWNLSASDAPSIEVMRDDIAVIEAECQIELDAWFAWAQVPFVAYASVNDGQSYNRHLTGDTNVNYQRRGIATEMYSIAGRQLAQQGQLLRASTLRSDSATGLWEYLVKSPEYPTCEVTVESGGNGPTVVPALDYR